MKIYHIIRMEKPDWNKAEKVELVHQPWLEPCAIRAWAQMCHDEENLYIRMEAEEKNIRATLTGLLDAICTDSCMEFFFAPCAGDKRYMNFEWNLLGAVNFGFGAERATRVRQVVKDANAMFAPKPFETEKGWGIECLAAPDTVELCWEQNQKGFALPLDALSAEKCAQALYNAVKA